MTMQEMLQQLAYAAGPNLGQMPSPYLAAQPLGGRPEGFVAGIPGATQFGDPVRAPAPASKPAPPSTPVTAKAKPPKGPQAKPRGARPAAPAKAGEADFATGPGAPKGREAVTADAYRVAQLLGQWPTNPFAGLQAADESLPGNHALQGPLIDAPPAPEEPADTPDPNSPEAFQAELDRILGQRPKAPNLADIQKQTEADMLSEYGAREKPNATGVKGVFAKLGKAAVGALQGIAEEGLAGGGKGALKATERYVTNKEDSEPWDAEYQRRFGQAAGVAQADYQAKRQEFEDQLKALQLKTGMSDAAYQRERQKLADQFQRDQATAQFQLQAMQVSARQQAQLAQAERQVAALEARATDAAQRGHLAMLRQSIQNFQKQREATFDEIRNIKKAIAAPHTEEQGRVYDATLQAWQDRVQALDAQIGALTGQIGTLGGAGGGTNYDALVQEAVQAGATDAQGVRDYIRQHYPGVQ